VDCKFRLSSCHHNDKDIGHTGVIFATARRKPRQSLGEGALVCAITFRTGRMVNYFSLPLTARRALTPNVWDIVAFSLIFMAFVLIAHEAQVTTQPLAVIDATPVSLDPRNLPDYALRTTMRMFAAILASLV